MTANWYPGKKSIILTPLKRVARKPKEPTVKLKPTEICPICDGKGIVKRPNGDWTPCAAGPPYHKVKK